jgi:ATP-dependent RNA helicase RhlE
LTTFEQFGLAPHILKSIKIIGFDQPTPIQSKAIPIAVSGRDIMGIAQTGTGKTAAFGLPLVNHLMASDIRPAPKTTQALILAPTRELANQIAENLRLYVRGTRLKVNVVVGGTSLNHQCRKLAVGTDILVATPGRLVDLIERKALTLQETNFLVLDEADQMLDLGFIHSLRKIARMLATPRQTMLFSATMPKQMAELASAFLIDPVRVDVAPSGRPIEKIRQSVHFVSQDKKAELLEKHLAERPDDLSIVFSRTKHGAEKLMKRLVAKDFRAASIHGNKSQNQRDRAIRDFKSGKLRILVATDVAARGIDIPGVSHVYNFDLPEVPENYVHRIGRTARAGADGQALAYCSAAEVHLLAAIEKVMGLSVDVGSGERPVGEPSAAPRRGSRNKGRGNNGRGNNERSNGASRRGGKPGQSSSGEKRANPPKPRRRRPRKIAAA